MFPVLMTVFGLALSVSASVAGLSYIAPVYKQAMARVELARDINVASEISSALMMLQMDGQQVSDQDAIASLQQHQLLTVLPAGWTVSGGVPVKALNSVAQCMSLNDVSGIQNASQNSMPGGSISQGSSPLLSPAPCPPCDDSAGLLACQSSSGPIFRLPGST